MKKIVSKLITMICAVFMLFTTTTFASTTEKLNFGAYKQEETSWCWAACIQSIANYLLDEEYIEQSEIVKYVKGDIINEGANLFEQEAGLDYCGFEFDESTKVLSFAKIKKEIDNSRPILVDVKNEIGSGSHCIVIYGYVEGDTSSENKIWYMDPSPKRKTFNSLKYSLLAKNLNFSWKRCYYNIHEK